MLTQPEYEGLRKLKIPLVEWGKNSGNFRVKVRSPNSKIGKRAAKETFVSNLTTKNIQAIADFYGKTVKQIEKAIESKDKTSKYRIINRKNYEIHEFEDIPDGKLLSNTERIMRTQKKAFKINIAVGYTLVDMTIPRFPIYQTFYPSSNTRIFDTPLRVNGRADIPKALSEITKALSEETKGAAIKFADSKLKIHSIDRYHVYIYKLDANLGDDHDSMPDYIKQDTNLMSPRDTRNKCLFHCIAYHNDRTLQQHRLKKPAKALFEQYCAFKGMIFEARGNTLNQYYKTFKPIDLMELDEVEDCFNLCIDVYSIDDEDPVNRGVERVRDSTKNYENRMAIVSCMNHAIYVRNTNYLIGQYVCHKCLMTFKTSLQKANHVKNNCEMVEIKTFPKEPTIYEPKRNVMKMICDGYKPEAESGDELVQQRKISPYQEHFIVYDFEVIQPKLDIKVDADGNIPDTRFTTEHIPCSVSVCSSRTKEAVCFVNSDVKTLLKEMFMWVAEETTQIRRYYDSYYSEMFDTICETHKKEPRKAMDKIHSIMDGYAQVPLVGFNSGKYDINIMKKYLFGVLAEINAEFSAIGLESILKSDVGKYFVIGEMGPHLGSMNKINSDDELYVVPDDRRIQIRREGETCKVDSVIKKANGYMCVSTKAFKMLDITNYLPAGTSYDQYLKTYLGGCKCDDKIRCVCGLGKGIFPYEYITNFDVLNQTTIPSKEAFNSSLKGTTISDDDYKRVEFVWNHYGMKSIKDLLIWYNNLDVVPFVDAIKVQREFYRQYELDMFKDGVSLPGLAEKIMFNTSFKDLPTIEIERSAEEQIKIDKWMKKNDFTKKISRGGVVKLEKGKGFAIVEKYKGKDDVDPEALKEYIVKYHEHKLVMELKDRYKLLEYKLERIERKSDDELRNQFERMDSSDKMFLNYSLGLRVVYDMTVDEFIACKNTEWSREESLIRREMVGTFEEYAQVKKIEYVKSQRAIQEDEFRVQALHELAHEIKTNGLSLKSIEAGEYLKRNLANKIDDLIRIDSEKELRNNFSVQFWKQGYRCKFCYCEINKENFQLDQACYWDENIEKPIIVCADCKKEREGRSYKAFSRAKLLQFHANRLIFSIDEQQSDIYQTMKDNIVGGPSIIFKRYARATNNKRDGTEIRSHYVKRLNRCNGEEFEANRCNKIIGYDANALYLWALSQDMPCGRLERIDTYDTIVDDIRDDKIFGFLECDIHVPDHLKENFEEMCPIFKNVLIEPTEEVIGKHMFEYNDSRRKNEQTYARKSRKLIGSMFGEKILLYTPLIQFYLRHGLVITKTYSFIKAARARPFAGFADDVSNARRAGDADKNQELIADAMKLVGNSAFGRTGMDMTKHKKVKYTTDDSEEMKLTNHFTFQDKEDLDGACEITLKKRKIKQNNPIHVAIAIYQLAKLRMLEFYYDCIDKYIPRECFEYLEMDTDSAYIAFAMPKDAPKNCPNPFDYIIRDGNLTWQTKKGKTKSISYRDHWEANKHKWFPRTDTEDNAAYDKRTPGLFKQEWSGGSMISLSSKNYICTRPDKVFKEKGKTGIKISAKGVQKNRNSGEDGCLTRANFRRILKEKITIKATNKGFRLCKDTQTMKTYEQYKTGLNYYYDKRQVLEDGITTIPLNL
jgi:hypothetical protein